MRVGAFAIACSIAVGGMAASALAAAEDPAGVRVTSCQIAESSTDRAATFVAHMRAIPNTEQMAMRFTLRERLPNEAPAAVASPALEVWHRSRVGVQDFSYAQTVDGLDTGAVYTAAVEFRWLDATGHALHWARRSSGECQEAGPLADLHVTGVSAVPGPQQGTQDYSIGIVNDGQLEQHLTRVTLFVDGALAGRAPLWHIDPGESRTVHVAAPTCTHRIRVVLSRPGELPRVVAPERCPTSD